MSWARDSWLPDTRWLRASRELYFPGLLDRVATNLATPVANAKADSIPLLVLTGQVDRRYLNRNILQYCDNIELLGQFCKKSTQAVSVSELPNLIATGLQLALSGRPGPVHIDLPQSLQAETVDKVPENFQIRIDSACSWPARYCRCASIASGKRKTCDTGGTRRSQIHIVGDIGILGKPDWRPGCHKSFRNRHNAVRLSFECGMLGFYGPSCAREAIAEADLVIVVGCALGEQTTFGWRSDLFASNVKNYSN